MTIAIGESGMKPAGNTTPSLGGYNFFTTGAYWIEMGRTVTGDAVAANSDALIASFGAVNLTLSWFGSTVNAGNSLYGMPFNTVIGTQALKPVTVDPYQSQSDLGPIPFYSSMSIQGWPGLGGDTWITKGIGSVAVTNGSPNVVGTTTTFTVDLLVGDTIVFANQSTLYTILAISNDTHLALTSNYTGTTASGLTANGPFNRPPLSTYLTGSDVHGLVLVRNESSPAVASNLYEYYQVFSDDGGATWGAAGGSVWDMATGAPRVDGYTSTTAGGTPLLPLLVRYDEIVNGVIPHPLRLIIGTGLSMNRYVWPARHFVTTGSVNSGLPMGARLRLKSSWYNANISSYSTTNQIILTCLKTYGGIVNDLTGSGLWIDGVNDDRWDHNDLANLHATVPVSAFEVLDTIKPQLSLTGPTSGAVGVPQTYTVTHLIPDNSNFDINVYLQWSSDGGDNWSSVGVSPGAVPINDTHRGPSTMDWTPGAPGSYLLKTAYSDVGWIYPPQIAFSTGTANDGPPYPMFADGPTKQITPPRFSGGPTQAVASGWI